MISAVIIDDEKQCINALQNDLKMFCPDITLLATANSAKSGLELLSVCKPDLLFLDIEMPLMNGLEMLERLEKPFGFQVIFTTAYEQFATRAFRINATDYLLKPIDGQELMESVDRVRKSLEQTHPERVTENYPRIAFPHRNGFDLISPQDILYCAAEGAYTRIITVSGKVVMFSKALGTVQKSLPPTLFDRVHHSFLINVLKVREVSRNENKVIMENGDEVSLSRSKKKIFLKKITSK